MITRARYYGGFREVTAGGTTALSLKTARVQYVNPTVASPAVRLDDARLLKTGRASGWVVNTSGSNSIALQDSAGGALATIGVGQSATCFLIGNSTAAGSWRIFVRNVLT